MKKAVRSNFRVEVYPRSPGDFSFGSISGTSETEEESTSRCESIAAKIERHVDGLPYRGAKTCIIWDTEYVCEHCGYRWSEDSEQYNGGCCTKDIDHQVEDTAEDSHADTE